MENPVPTTRRVSKLEIFYRLTRSQFLPLILLPTATGTALAFRATGSLKLDYFLLVLLGVVLLHLGANAIDDCYDFQNGVDAIANSMFPLDFGGWKPLPRGLITLRNAKVVSGLLFFGSFLISLYFWTVVGYWSFILAAAGILLATFYTAPPFKLDYRGKGLGEIAILFAFGPIPVLGAYYVQTATLSLSALLVSIPIGIMTVTILMDHDIIFFEVYQRAKKFSLGAVLGRSRTLSASLYLTLISYAMVAVLVAERVLPLLSLAAPIISAIILSRKSKIFRQSGEAPPFYVPFTVNALLSNWMFALLLAVTVALPFH
jgi:1,4-dihydroxy-2-naphthoate polyprenyltransferase